MKSKITYFLIMMIILGSCTQYEKDDTAPVPARYIKVGSGNIIKTEIYDTLILDARQTGITVYMWKSTNTYLYAKIINPDSPQVVVRDTGAYTVIFNNGQDSSKVIVYPVPSCYIPNCFTPDNIGSNMNNYWRPIIGGISLYQLMVYSGDHIKLFETTDIQSTGWDGTYNGKPCPMGNYYYYLKYTSLIGKEYNQTGYVQLLR